MRLSDSVVNANNREATLKNVSAQKSREIAREKELDESKKQDNVTKIKDEIKNGTYKVDLHKTSDKMAQHLLNL